jgi:hypothetical protein
VLQTATKYISEREREREEEIQEGFYKQQQRMEGRETRGS